MYETDSNSVIQQFRSMWTEQGDYLSRQYAGTDSTISRVSRDGKEGFLGKLDHKTKVVQRFFINTFAENPMQTAIDIVLGKHLKTAVSSEQRKFVEGELAKLVDKYSKLNTYNLNIASWNLGGNRPLE